MLYSLQFAIMAKIQTDYGGYSREKAPYQHYWLAVIPNGSGQFPPNIFHSFNDQSNHNWSLWVDRDFVSCRITNHRSV